VPNAEQVATALAYEFLKKGNYSASSGPIEVPGLLQVAAVADVVESGAEFQVGTEFAGLAVQSVGFEDGVDDPKVHIYLTRGSARLIKELPEEIEQVPLRAHKMGPISVRRGGRDKPRQFLRTKFAGLLREFLCADVRELLRYSWGARTATRVAANISSFE
jgi:hypothetical protein